MCTGLFIFVDLYARTNIVVRYLCDEYALAGRMRYWNQEVGPGIMKNSTFPFVLCIVSTVWQGRVEKTHLGMDIEIE